MLGFYFVVFLLVSAGGLSVDRDKRNVRFPGSEPNTGGQGGSILFPDSGQASTCRTPSGQSGACVSYSECASVYINHEELEAAACSQAGKVCCPNEEGGGGGAQAAAPTRRQLTELRNPGVNVPTEVRGGINRASEMGLQMVSDTTNLERTLNRQGVFIRRGTPAARHVAFFQPSEESRQLSKQAMANLEAAKSLVSDFNLTPRQGSFGLQEFSVRDTPIDFTCPPTPRCDSRSKYRTADGSCNNLRNPNWGKSRTAFQRIIFPDYADGLEEPRRASDGSELPSARLVSSTVSPDVDDPYKTISLMVMQWGQFIDHDFTLAPVVVGEDLRGIQCCRDGHPIAANQRHPACLPIEIPENDPFYAQFGQRCMEFAKSMLAPRPNCDFGYAEQLNALTHYIDGSMVYGSDKERSDELRELQGGRLKTQRAEGGGKDLLPPSTTEHDECTNFTSNVVCFKGGDVRVNEQIDLAVMHTIWVREHNRIVKELAALNPRWTDEALYQEGRRIVAAQIQHITYNEWLPLILGRNIYLTYGLHTRRFGFSRDYDPSINPSVTNSFASAAFRFGHTLLQGMRNLFGPRNFPQPGIKLHEHLNSPFLIKRPGAMDSLTRGLLNQKPQRFDNFITESVSNRLFQGAHPFGLDLVSLNLQRGREHGIPGYNDLRELCGLRRARSFRDLSGEIPSSALSSIQKVYKNVDDIDLFIGGISEKSLRGAVVGPTFACLIADVFARLKIGDRFFYDLQGQTGSFTRSQLNQIRRTSLARVVCDNTDSITEMQPLIFLAPLRRNRQVSCNSISIKKMSLAPWKGERVPV